MVDSQDELDALKESWREKGKCVRCGRCPKMAYGDLCFPCSRAVWVKEYHK